MSDSAPNYKDTLTLPQTTFPMRGDLVENEPKRLGALGKRRTLRENHRPPPRAERPGIHPPRRPALREWRRPHGHRAQQAAQGSGGEIQDDGRFHRALHPRLGLPRAADRVQGRQGNRRSGACGDPPPLHGVRHEIHRHPARFVPPARGVRRLEKPVSHDESRLRGEHPARLRQARGKRLRSIRRRSRSSGPTARKPRSPRPRSNIRTRKARRSS